jgi:hypothetical protein
VEIQAQDQYMKEAQDLDPLLKAQDAWDPCPVEIQAQDQYMQEAQDLDPLLNLNELNSLKLKKKMIIWT